MNKTFFARFAVPILMLVFFTVPFALRGARMSFTTMKNDVKDWLPDSFEETKDLEWFRDNFLGEQFVLVTWPGCTAEDTRFKLLVEKLRNEIPHDELLTAKPPADENAPSDAPADDGEPAAAGLAAIAAEQAFRAREMERTRQLGDRLGLAPTRMYYENWGGRDEKWVIGDKEVWYYITPKGELYRWDGGNNLLGWAGRKIERLFTGKNTASGELVATVGVPAADNKPNEFHADPRKLSARFFKTVTTGPDVLARLAGPNGGLWPRGDYSDEEKQEIAERTALQRLTGGLFGPDGKQTCLVITLSDVGRRDLKRALGRELMGKPAGRLLQIAQEAGLSYDDLRMGGPPVDNVAIDEEGSITLVRLIGWSLALGVGLAYLSFRSFKITFMIFFVGGMSAIMSLSLVWYAGDSVDAIVMSMPSLIYVLGLTEAVHMLTFYRHHAIEHGLEGAAESTVKHTWKPILVSQLTSTIGLLCLLTSELSPIRKFGWYSALGTIATIILMYSYLPSALQLWPPGYHKRRERAQATGQPDGLDRMARFWGAFSAFIVRNHYWISPAVFMFLLLMAYGTTKLKTTVQLLKMFDGNSKIIRDYAWLEQNLGKLVPMEIVVRVSPDLVAPATTGEPAEGNEGDSKVKSRSLEEQFVQYNFLERMELADHVQRAVESKFGPGGQQILGQGMSAVTFAPPLPEPGSGWRNSRGVLNRKLEEHRDEFLASEYLRVDKDPVHAGSELWRISLRLGALNDVDYGAFVNDLKSVVEPVMSACRYREAALASLAQTRDGKGLNGARVAVLGLSKPSREKSTGKTSRDPEKNLAGKSKIRSVVAKADEQWAKPTNVLGATREDQDRLFSTTLADLMENRGFRTSADAKTRLEFLDDEALQDEQGRPLSDDALAAKLKTFDCVIVARDLAGLNLANVRQHNQHVIDARDFTLGTQTGSAEVARRDAPVHAIYTGVVPVVYKAQRSLLDSLVSSTNWAFVSIAFCMMLLLRSGRLSMFNLINCRAGIVAMLPNMFPLIVVFGAIGYLGIEVDIGSMMTASIAIGVAVDDTIHYLEWFRNGMKSGLTRREAIIAGYQHSGSAIIETMLIGGLGLSVFAFSTFTPTQRFGTMMLTMLAVGAIGELIWMPALLAGPLGKYFEPKPDEITPSDAVLATSAGAELIATEVGKMQHDAPHSRSGNVVRRDSAH